MILYYHLSRKVKLRIRAPRMLPRAVSWCFTPSQPVRLYQGNYQRQSSFYKGTMTVVTGTMLPYSTVHPKK